MAEGDFKWYVVTTRPRAEKKVAAGFCKIGVEHYLPLQKQLKQWNDRKKWVEVPLFNSYIFVFIHERERNLVFEVPGVLKFLSIKGKLSELNADEIERIKKICAQEHSIIIESGSLANGVKVEITEGPLKGLKGIIAEKSRNAFLYIHIKNLGFTASFKIDKNLVRCI